MTSNTLTAITVSACALASIAFGTGALYLILIDHRWWAVAFFLAAGIFANGVHVARAVQPKEDL